MAAERIEIRRCFEQEDFNRFAALSGDDNPIHVNPAFAARSRFGRPVAHGLLLWSVLQGLVERLRPGRRITGHDLMFPAPAYAGDTLRFRTAVLAESGDESRLEVEVRRVEDGELCCQGQCTLAR